MSKNFCFLINIMRLHGQKEKKVNLKQSKSPAQLYVGNVCYLRYVKKKINVLNHSLFVFFFLSLTLRYLTTLRSTYTFYFFLCNIVIIFLQLNVSIHINQKSLVTIRYYAYSVTFFLYAIKLLMADVST